MCRLIWVFYISFFPILLFFYATPMSHREKIKFEFWGLGLVPSIPYLSIYALKIQSMFLEDVFIILFIYPFFLQLLQLVIFQHYLQGAGLQDGPLRSDFVSVVRSLTCTRAVSPCTGILQLTPWFEVWCSVLTSSLPMMLMEHVQSQKFSRN